MQRHPGATPFGRRPALALAQRSLSARQRANADGKGRAAKLYDPKPANLHVSPYNDTYKEMIIRCGGQRIARSEFMPPWGEELTDEQIRDVIAYLKSILTVSPPLQSARQ